MTPAETLASKKQRQRPKRNTPASSERVLWTCGLSELREQCNLSMRDVAESVGLSVSAYFRIEKGYADVSLSNAMNIAKFFGKTICEIWTQWRDKE